MKLFIKMLLFIFVAFFTNEEVTSAIISFTHIHKITAPYSLSYHGKLPEINFKVIESDSTNCCKNE